MLLVQVPTPSTIAVIMLLVGNTDLFTEPQWSPSLPLHVVVAFWMRNTFWRHVRKAIPAKFFSRRTVCWVDVPFIQIPADASPCKRFPAILWRIMAQWRRQWSTAVPMTASLIVFIASSRSISRLLHWAFAVQHCWHRTIVIAVIGCVFRWWLLNQLLQPLDEQVDHVCSFTGLWRRHLLMILLLVRSGLIIHHVDNGVGIVYFVVQVIGLDIALCLRQIRYPCLLCGVGNIGGDHETLHDVVELDAVGGGLCDCGEEIFEICCDTLLSIKCRCHHVHHNLSDRCCGWSFGSTHDGAEHLMERILMDRSEVRSICFIAASRVVFCQSASSWAPALVVI